jgi:hypothetical protein
MGGQGELHVHRCCECGESWFCTSNCLEKCKCIGKPVCMHFHCVKCRDSAIVPYFVMPGGGGP